MPSTAATIRNHWDKGSNNLVDYFTKHHSPAHHKAVRPIYLYDKQQQLSREGCIKILQHRANIGKKLRLNKSVKTVVASAHTRTNRPADSKSVTSKKDCYSNYRTRRMRTLLEAINRGQIV